MHIFPLTCKVINLLLYYETKVVVVNQVVLFKGATSRYFPSFYRLKLVFGSTEFLNDVLVLLFKTIFWHSNCFPSTVATGGKDGHGLKLEFKCYAYKNHRKNYYSYCSLMKVV